MKRMFLYLFSISLFCSCELLIEDPKPLYLQRQEYSGNHLKINGYYSQIDNNEIRTIYLFYQNGIVFSAGSPNKSLNEADNYVQSLASNRSRRQYCYDWGVFIIDSIKIKFERWYPGYPFPSYVRAGEIINDSTFLINESYRMINGQKTEVQAKNETYYFRAFSPKPDSTNIYIK